MPIGKRQGRTLHREDAEALLETPRPHCLAHASPIFARMLERLRCHQPASTSWARAVALASVIWLWQVAHSALMAERKPSFTSGGTADSAKEMTTCPSAEKVWSVVDMRGG